MQSKHNKQLVPLAKQLRKEMTKGDLRLWYDYLRSYPVRFLRQRIMGKYTVDFYCAESVRISMLRSNNPSVSCADSSLYTRGPLTLHIVTYSKTPTCVDFTDRCLLFYDYSAILQQPFLCRGTERKKPSECVGRFIS